MDKKEAAKKLLDLSSKMNDENQSKELINIASFIVDMDDFNKKEKLIKLTEAFKNKRYFIKDQELHEVLYTTEQDLLLINLGLSYKIH